MFDVGDIVRRVSHNGIFKDRIYIIMAPSFIKAYGDSEYVVKVLVRNMEGEVHPLKVESFEKIDV